MDSLKTKKNHGCKIIAVIQQKGGGTKTTTSINLGMALNEHGYKTLIGDMDSAKPDAVQWSEMGECKIADNVMPIFKDNPRQLISGLQEQYDFIILDTPPNLDGAALKAAILADLIIIPCSPSTLDQMALIRAVECALFAEKPFKLLASKVKKNTISSRQLMEDLKEAGQCFNTMITNSVVVEGAPSVGDWVGGFKPKSDSHIQYQELAQEVINEFVPMVSNNLMNELAEEI